jgi:hypothetical protein
MKYTLFALFALHFNMFLDSCFANNDLSSFTSGNVAKYTTSGHPKAKDAKFSIRFPSSWKTSEDSRPNTVQNIVSKGGLGLEMVSILTKKLPLEPPIPEEEINNFLTEENFRDIVPKDSEFIGFSKTTIEGTPAGIFEWVSDSSRGGINFYLYQKALGFIQGSTYIQVTCSVSVDKEGSSKEDILQQADRFSTLFTLILNSIVFEDIY